MTGPKRRAAAPARSFWSCLVGILAFSCTLGVLLIVGLLTNGGELATLLGAPPLLPAAGDLQSDPVQSAEVGAPLTSTPTRTPSPSPTRRPPSPTPRPTARPAPASPPPPAGPYPSRVIQAFGQTITVVEHFLLSRPVPAGSEGSSPEWHYLYGTTEGGTLRVHHGNDFDNPLGTPLLAVANGTIVVAEPDSGPVCGNQRDELCGPQPEFYGNPVVERLDLTYKSQPVYILYGHLDSYAVSAGQHVTTGQTLGAIGESGIADGPHVHLEVRIGVDDYAHTRNSFLWLKPLAGTGLLTGRVLDRDGRPVLGAVVDLYMGNGSQEFEWTETYSTDDTAPVVPDDDLKENYVLGDLPAGDYLLRVEIGGQSYYQNVTIQAGHISYLLFHP